LGHHVDAVCPDKKSGDKIITSIHDFEGEQTYSEKRGHYFLLNADFEGARAEDYDGLMSPGGRAPEYLRLDPRVIELTQAFNAADKPIAAICHGPQVLVSADVARGKSCTAYPSVRPELEAVGADWVDPGEGLDEVHANGNLITAPAWPANGLWTRKFLEVLGAPPAG
ncbi:MAG: DJ-1/PfpI family protein, partial [Planctomycetales bacterium]